MSLLKTKGLVVRGYNSKLNHFPIYVLTLKTYSANLGCQRVFALHIGHQFSHRQSHKILLWYIERVTYLDVCR